MGNDVLIHCPHCGSDDVIKNYNYDTALIDYECRECGADFTDNNLQFCDGCGEQIIGNGIWDDGYLFCSMECCNTFNETNN